MAKININDPQNFNKWKYSKLKSFVTEEQQSTLDLGNKMLGLIIKSGEPVDKAIYIDDNEMSKKDFNSWKNYLKKIRTR